MEFNKKLQELRKQKGLTQEELAHALFVSRTAISKWESGRGYPNIDSLKAIATFFGIMVDELLSTDEILTIAEEDSRQKENHFLDLNFGLLDISNVMFLFIPFFRQKLDGIIQTVSLLSLTQISLYLKVIYYIITIGIITFGVLNLLLQNFDMKFWVQNKTTISLILNIIGLILFIISLQPYPSIYLLILLAIKVLILTNKRRH